MNILVIELNQNYLKKKPVCACGTSEIVKIAYIYIYIEDGGSTYDLMNE